MHIEVKFTVGQDVEHFTGIQGRIIGIYHYGAKTSYQMSYLVKDGSLTSQTCEECELSALTRNGGIGFRKATE